MRIMFIPVECYSEYTVNDYTGSMVWLQEYGPCSTLYKQKRLQLVAVWEPKNKDVEDSDVRFLFCLPAYFQEKEMEKQKLLYQQARLHDRGAAEMVLQTISASKGTPRINSHHMA